MVAAAKANARKRARRDSNPQYPGRLAPWGRRAVPAYALRLLAQPTGATGFEPATTGLGGQSLIQARLRARAGHLRGVLGRAGRRRFPRACHGRLVDARVVGWLVLLACLAAPPAAGQAIIGVVPDLDDGDGWGVCCDLAGWTVTDEETTWTVPAGSGAAWATGNSSQWLAHGGPPATHIPGLRLNNQGEALRLVNPAGEVVHEVDWAGAGAGGFARLWVPGEVERVRWLGQSDLDQPTWHIEGATLYRSPDNAFEVLTELLRAAQERVVLHVYGLRSLALGDALVAAADRVPVAVLVDESPVGMDRLQRHQTAYNLQRLVDAGAEVVTAGDRYRHHHLKVLVVDDRVAIQSENWVESGVPEVPTTGNRGWGIVLPHRPAADWFAAWMAEDRAAWDADSFDLASFDPGYEPPARFPPRTGTYRPGSVEHIIGPMEVTPFVAPDHTVSPELYQLVAESGRAWAQQLQMREHATNRLGLDLADPFLLAFTDGAHARDIRVHLAAPFGPDDERNQQVVRAIQAAGGNARLWDHPDLGILHNKAVVLDDGLILGSLNGNHASRSENREVGLYVHSQAAAQTASQWFLSDWQPSRDWGAIADDLEAIPGPGFLAVAATAIFAMLVRCREGAGRH